MFSTVSVNAATTKLVSMPKYNVIANNVKSFTSNILTAYGLTGFVNGDVSEVHSFIFVVLLVRYDSPAFNTEIAKIVNAPAKSRIIVQVTTESIFMVTLTKYELRVNLLCVELLVHPSQELMSSLYIFSVSASLHLKALVLIP